MKSQSSSVPTGRRNGLWTLCFALIFSVTLPAAAHQGAPPPSMQQNVKALSAVPQLMLPATDVQSELAADVQRKGVGPLRFATARPVVVTPATHGAWEPVANGRLWRLRVVSAGATDLNLGFTTYWLPKGASLYVIAESEAYYQGPYMDADNTETGQLWTPVVPGEAAVIELFVPADAQEEPRLVLTQVSTGYRDLFHRKDGTGLPKAESCEIDVVCPQAVLWTNEIRSVARISIGGTSLCSATMIMDAAGDFKNYLLTANHCGINSANASSVVAYWNYQSPTCGQHGLGGSLSQNTSGATFRAAKYDVDFCLIELTSTPDSSYGVYYAGWDRSGTAPAGCVGIHHPNADGKCISFSSNALTTANSCIGTGGISTHWDVTWSLGVTEHGSSGSGIWDPATHKVVGTLSGGGSDCTTPLGVDCYGKFSVSWASGTAATNRLRDWLDASNTGVTSVGGAYPPTLANDQCSGAIALMTGSTYIMSTTTATSTGDPVPGCGYNPGKGVWFTYAPPASGTVTISTCGSDFDTVLAVYSGACGSLTQVACDDDSGPACSGTAASVSFTATLGATYYILAAGYNGVSGNLHILAALPNDGCAGAIPLMPDVPVTLDTTTATSTNEAPIACRPNSGASVWFSFTPAVNELVLISTCGSSFDTVLAVYSGTCGSLTQVACDDDSGPGCSGVQASVSFSGLAGTTYYIQAAGFVTNTGTLQIVARVSNDECSGSIALTPGVPYNLNTTDATSVNDPAPCAYNFGKGVWFRFTATNSGVVAITLCGSDFDTAVQVYTGSCGALTEVPNGCDDDWGWACQGNRSSVAFPASVGTTYYILAGGYNSYYGNLSIVANVVPPRVLTVNSFPNTGVSITTVPSDINGLSDGSSSYSRTYPDGATVYLTASANDGFNVFQKWQLDGVDYTNGYSAIINMTAAHTATAVYVPPNDQCAGAIALSAGMAYAENTTGATATGDPNSACGAPLGHGVWFTFTSTNSGVVTLSACGSDFDTVLQAYTGPCGGLAAVPYGCNDDSYVCGSGSTRSWVAFAGTAGTTYYIIAGGFGASFGNLSLTANLVAPRTLTIGSTPYSGVTMTLINQNDTTSLSSGPTPLSLTYGDGSVASVTAPPSDGFNVFQKWELDGADYSTSNTVAVTMSANHALIAVYAPPNDTCANAIALSAGVPFAMNTTTATSAGDPSPTCQNYTSNGVWFTFTAPSNGVVTVSACPSDFDTVVQVYTGTCGALTPAVNGCNDDAGFTCPYRQSFVQFPGTGGTTYHILAGGYFGYTGNLNITAKVVPARTLTVTSVPFTGLTNLVYPADIYGYGGGVTAASFTYADGLTVAVTAPSSDGFDSFQKWQLDGADLTTSLTAYVTMSANHNLAAIYSPPNDYCSGAIRLTDGVAFTMANTTATDTGDPQVPCGSLHNGVWFNFVPAIDEQVTVSTCGSSIDTVLQVFTGDCGRLKRIPYGCDDDNGPACLSLMASVVFSGHAGATNYILVGSYGVSGGPITVTATSGLVNDNCATALPLAYGVPFTMTTANATTGAGETPTCRPNFGKSVWFTFTSPITGPVPISTCGSSFDTVLQVYTGTCGALTPVICADDNGPYCVGINASLTLNATAGTSYYIMAGGYNSYSGNLTIIAGTHPVITADHVGNYVQLTWPAYYWPNYVLQRVANPAGIGSAGAWMDQLPNNDIFTFGTSNPPAFFRLVTP